MTYTSEEIYHIWLSSIDGIGPITFMSLLSVFGTPEALFHDAPQNRGAFDRVPRMSMKLRDGLIAACSDAYIEKFFARMEKNGIAAICRINELYPTQLKEVVAPPLTLFCKGRLELLKAEKMIAIIGTRDPTSYGREVAGKLGRALGAKGVTVVSGMARGIDICAHLGTLEAHGDTIAVLGNGVDIAYPAEKANVYEQICREGLAVSEYVPGTNPAPGNFPARNRIISGLACGVVVVEAGERSGTNITVNYALEQGKDIFAVPGTITSKTSYSTNLMIKSGCEVITNEEDVLAYYGWGGTQAKRSRAAKPAKPERMVELNFQERAITDALETNGKSFDELFELTGFSMPDLFTLLAGLEMKGVLEQKPGRVYFLKGGGA